MPVAFVLLFTAAAYQPKLTVGAITVTAADVAVLAMAAAALATGREGLRRLAPSKWLWLGAAAFLTYVLAASLYPLLSDGDYDWRKYSVSAAKFVEYGLIAPAVAVLVRERRDATRLWATVAWWSVLAALVGLLQFGGLDVFDAWRTWIRQPSFLGIPNLAALGGAALVVGFVGLLRPGTASRTVTAAALAGGVLSVVLAGALAAQIGVVLVAATAILLAVRHSSAPSRRLGAVALFAVVCGLGVLAMRGGDFADYARYVRLSGEERRSAAQTGVQTYAQRELMLYFAVRIWRDHPVFGAGWQSIHEVQVFSPYLADARRRYPDQPEQAFPGIAPDRRWGIDNAYVQALAELGAAGLGLLVAVLATGLVLGFRGAVRAPFEQAGWATIGLLWLILTIGLWIGHGLVAGGSHTALSWFALGLVAAAAASRTEPT